MHAAIELISYILFASILAHAFYALFITIKNRRANGKRYMYDRRGVSSKWYSRTMGLLGTIILVFLVIHLRDTEACQVECPQEISVLHIARMNWEYNRALLS